jgi:hypothetical protein
MSIAQLHDLLLYARWLEDDIGCTPVVSAVGARRTRSRPQHARSALDRGDRILGAVADVTAIAKLRVPVEPGTLRARRPGGAMAGRSSALELDKDPSRLWRQRCAAGTGRDHEISHAHGEALLLR